MKRSTIVFFIILCLSASMAQAHVTLDDGDTHDISVPISENLYVEDGPGPTITTVNMHTGALIEPYWGLIARDSSLVNIYGGSIYSLVTDNSSITNIYGGSIGASGSGIITFGSSTVNIYGGSVQGSLIAIESGTFNIYGTGFNYPYGPIPDVDLAGTITGTLHLGDSLNLDFERSWYTTSIILHEMEVIPAPGAALLGVLGLLCLRAGGFGNKKLFERYFG